MLELLLSDCRKSFKRALFLISGSLDELIDNSERILKELTDSDDISQLEGVFIAKNLKTDRHSQKIVKSLKQALEPKVLIKELDFRDSRHLMGTSTDFSILDLRKQLFPNDLGIVIETTKGGGVVLLLIDSVETWLHSRTDFQKRITTPPFSEDDFVPRFNPWFLKTLQVSPGCFYLGKEDSWKYPSTDLLHKDLFTENLFGVPVTGDQVTVFNTVKEILHQKRDDKPKKIVVVTSNRGRGKSVALGVILGGVLANNLLKKRQTQALVTSPHPSNVQTLFDFALKTLEKLGKKPIEEKIRGWTDSISIPGGTINYLPPAEVVETLSDFIVVDEAAAIPVNLLKRILNQSERVIYSSTIHGYEGAGRSFSIRFLSTLRRQKEYQILDVSLETPIRYALNDSVEKWLFRVFLLDAEPSTLSKNEKMLLSTKKAIQESIFQFRKINRDTLFTLEKEHELRDLFGIFVFAHYRNQPNDALLLADAPHHDAYVLESEIESKKKILVGIQTCEEGNLPPEIIEGMHHGEELPGNIIPTCVLRYFDKDFPQLKGKRIVRIATHPDLVRKGLGSLSLKKLVNECEIDGYDWLGSSFGATKSLVKYWAKNGFSPIHIRSTANPSTGERSLIVIRPFNTKTKELVEKYSSEFLLQFLDWLNQTLFDLNPDLVLAIMDSCLPQEEKTPQVPRLTSSSRMRLERYIWKQIPLNQTLDAVKELSIWYFLNKPDNLRLSRGQKLLLVTRILQGRTWGQSMGKIRISWSDAQGLIHKAVKRLFNAYKEAEKA